MSRHSQHDDFNPPVVMAARFAYLVSLIALIAGVVLGAAALFFRDGRLAAGSVAGIAFAIAIRGGLKRQGRLAEAENAVRGMMPPGSGEQQSARSFFLLLREWEAMEARRGSPGFDPWAIQVLRNDISAAAGTDPALKREWQRRRAP